MSSKGPLISRQRAQSYNNEDDDNGYNENNSNGNSSNKDGPPRGNQQYGNIPKPSNTSRPTSGLSYNNPNPDQTGYQNKNYRKAFNPLNDDRDSEGNSVQRSESYE